MNDHDFWTEMRADPEADLPRLAYADWLDEQGDAKAEFVRASVRAANIPHGEPGSRLARAEERLAFKRHCRDWWESLVYPERCRLHRGIMRPYISIESAIKNEVFDRFPIDGIVASDIYLEPEALFQEPLRGLRYLSLAGWEHHRLPTWGGIDHAFPFERLHTLVLNGVHFGDHEGDAAALDRFFPNLHHLHIAGSGLKRKQLYVLGETKVFRESLRRLTADEDGATPTKQPLASETLEWSDMKLNSTTSGVQPERFPKLSYLDMAGIRPRKSKLQPFLAQFENLATFRCGPEWFPESAPSPLASLRDLEMLWPTSAEHTSRAFEFFAEHINRLVRLQLRLTDLEELDTDFEAIAELIGEASQLETLTLGEDAHRIIRELARSDAPCPSLRSLTVNLNWASDRRVAQLSAARCSLPNLDHLDLGLLEATSIEDFDEFLSTPLVQQVSMLGLNLGSDQVKNFCAALQKTSLPNVQVLMFSQYWPNWREGNIEEQLPSPEAFPSLKSLSFGGIGMHGAEDILRQRFKDVYDPEAFRLDERP